MCIRTSRQAPTDEQIRADVDMSRAEMWTNTMSCEYIHTHTYNNIIYSSGGWWGEDVTAPERTEPHLRRKSCQYT